MIDDPDEEATLPPGARLGRYELVRKLGAGGMSVVYLAYDPNLDRKVALKLMRTRTVGPDGALRLQREAQALAKLSHPNVVPVYDVDAVRGQAFVAMEYVEGQTLRSWSREKRSWRDVLAVLLDAGRGLAAAHAAGLVHRDFKPDNILIGNDGRVRVLDFGLARLASVLDGTEPSSRPLLPFDVTGTGASIPAMTTSDAPLSSGQLPDSGPSSSASLPSVTLTRADQIVGTPAYMAPEQVRSGPIDERADQFSFAVTLYEALFGERPFATPANTPVGSDVATMTVTVASAKVPEHVAPKAPPRGSPVPRWIQRAIVRALSRDPAARFPTIDALLRALTTDPHRAWRRVAGVGAVVVIAAVGVFAFERTGARDRAMCRGGASRVDATWGDVAKTDVRNAFVATKQPYADAAFATVSSSLGGYARKWADASDDACAATRLRGEQSDEILDLRMACLSTRLRGMNALVDELRHADADAVKMGAKAAHALPPIEECADVASLRAPSPRPRDKDKVARVEALEARLATIEAEVALGKEKDALANADGLLPDAEAVGFAPLVARVQLWRGRAAANLNDAKISIPALRDAFAAALASHEERVLKDAAARLVQEYVYAYDMAQYDTWQKIAQAALDRGAPEPKIQSFLDHTRCVALWQPGRLHARLDCLEKHAAKIERTRPLDEWELTTLGLAASDVGLYTRGLEYTRRGQAYSLAENGAVHPRTLEMRGYVCKALFDLGDIDAALTECTDALKDAEGAGTDNGYVVGKIRMYWGACLRETGRFTEARAQLDLARPHAEVAEIEAEIAQLETASGHAAQAVATLRKALEVVAKDLPPGHANVVVSKLTLGEALLATNAVAEARLVLDGALATCTEADLNPLMVADVELAAAKARLRGDATKKGEALDLARRAREAYEANAPHTKRYDAARARIDAWMAQAQASKP